MRIVMSILFSIAAIGSVVPASAATSATIVAPTSTHVLGCFPWSGCRK